MIKRRVSKPRRSQSQVSKDFEASLNAVVKIEIHQERRSDDSVDGKKPISLSLENASSITEKLKESISESLKKTSIKSNSSKKSKNSVFQLMERKSIQTDGVTDQHQKTEVNRITLFLNNVISKPSVTPFESTSVYNLPFNLAVTKENKEIFYISVFRYYTVNQTISIISKKIDEKSKRLALFYKNVRLQRNFTLKACNIGNHSHVFLTTLKKINITMNYENRSIPMQIYTSETVNELKYSCSQILHTDRSLIEVKFGEKILKDNVDLFFYKIGECSTLEIENFGRTHSNSAIEMYYGRGSEVVSGYLEILDQLESCDCYKIRINAISSVWISLINKQKYEKTILNEFGENCHLKTCPKYKNYKKVNSCRISNELSEDKISEISAAEVSLDNRLKAELSKMGRTELEEFSNADLDFLSTAKNFKEFKHFLKDKIGTHCDIVTVSKLYGIAVKLVSYINETKKGDEFRSTVLEYIKFYFKKYFEYEIVVKGGMVALSLEESDVE